MEHGTAGEGREGKVGSDWSVKEEKYMLFEPEKSPMTNIVCVYIFLQLKEGWEVEKMLGCFTSTRILMVGTLF